MAELDWLFTVETFGSQYPLPQHDVKVRPKKWALETARAAAANSPYQPVSDGEVALVANDLIWQLARYRSVPQADFADAWISEPRFGVDALSWMTRLTTDGALSGVQDVAGFSTYPGELAGPRDIQLKQYPAGESAIAFALVKSAFNNEPQEVRHLDHYLFPSEKPGFVIVLHFEWVDWQDDDAIKGTADDIMSSLAIEAAPTVPRASFLR